MSKKYKIEYDGVLGGMWLLKKRITVLFVFRYWSLVSASEEISHVEKIYNTLIKHPINTNQKNKTIGL